MSRVNAITNAYHNAERIGKSIDVELCRVTGARAHPIHRYPSGDLDPHRLSRLQSQTGVELGAFEHSWSSAILHLNPFLIHICLLIVM